MNKGVGHNVAYGRNKIVEIRKTLTLDKNGNSQFLT